MKIGPDGSLCRITNSAKDCSNNFIILKVPDSEEKKPSYLNYKLVSICPKSYQGESSSSDKSDEDIDENEETENNREENIKDKSTDKTGEKEKIITNNKSRKGKGFRSFKKRHRNRRTRSRNPPSSRRHYVPNNVNNSKQLPPQSEDISPWLNPPQMVNYSTFPIQYPKNYQPFNTSLDQILNSSSNCDTPLKPCGLLGDSPFSTVPLQFHSNQSIPYTPSQSYWNNEYEYEYHSSNYQRPVPDRQISLKRRKFQRNRSAKYWRSESNKKSKGWNKTKPQMDRGKSSQYYSYDYRK